MKKLVITLSLALALAIAAAVSLPALAATTEVGSTTISVTIDANIIDVTIPEEAGTIDMGSATPADPGTSDPFDVIVGSNADSWALVVADQRTFATPIPVKGYMDNAVDTSLTNPTEVQGGDVLTWAALTSDQTLYTGTGAGEATVSGVEFQQQIEYTDPAGTYSITVTFLGVTY